MSTSPIPSIRGSSSAWSPNTQFRLSEREGVETLFLAPIGDWTGKNWAKRVRRLLEREAPQIRKLFQCRPFRSMAPWQSPTTVCLTNESRCIALLHLLPIVSATFQRRDRLRNIGRKTAASPTIRGAKGVPQRTAAKASSDSVEGPSGRHRRDGYACRSIALLTVSLHNLPSQERPRLPTFHV